MPENTTYNSIALPSAISGIAIIHVIDQEFILWHYTLTPWTQVEQCMITSGVYAGYTGTLLRGLYIMACIILGVL